MIEQFDVLGVHVSATNLDITADRIDQMIRDNQKQYICIAPVATVMDAQRDSEYRNVVNNAGMVTPDGMPLVWLGRRKKGEHVNRTYGPDLLLHMAQYGLNKGFKHYFYGGSPEACEKLRKQLQCRFPEMNIVGMYSPPFRPGAEVESEDILKKINSARPDILWVGLGSPKQDYWMAKNRPHLDVPVMIGVGAAFDFLSGLKPQAPKWMQRSGLEWLFRLMCEPKRLWKRYLIGNTQFIWLLMMSKFKASR